MPVDGKRWLLAATVGLAMAAGAPGAHAATSPQVAVEPEGAAHLGWLDGMVTARSWPAGGALTEPQHLSALRVVISDFDLAADHHGRATFVWRRLSDTARVEGRRRLGDGSLGPLLAISSPGAETLSARVATDAAGNSVFVWRRAGSPSSYVFARRLSAAGVLGPPLTLSPANAISKEPEVAMDGDGNALVVWIRHASGGGEVVQARPIAADGTLGATKSVSTSAAAATEPQVAFDSAGNALIAWSRYDGNGFFPQIRRRSASGALSSIQTLSPANGTSAQGLRLAVAPGGSALAVWTRVAGLDPVLWARHRAADGTLGTTFRVSPDTSEHAYSAHTPDVAMDAAGNALITWQLRDEAEAGDLPWIQARRRAANGALGLIQRVSPASARQSALRPRIGAAADGTATLTWQTTDHFDPEDEERVHARRRRADGTLTPIVRVDAP